MVNFLFYSFRTIKISPVKYMYLLVPCHGFPCVTVDGHCIHHSQVAVTFVYHIPKLVFLLSLST
jgi:hypothetical protein